MDYDLFTKMTPETPYFSGGMNGVGFGVKFVSCFICLDEVVLGCFLAGNFVFIVKFAQFSGYF